MLSVSLVSNEPQHQLLQLLLLLLLLLILLFFDSGRLPRCTVR